MYYVRGGIGSGRRELRVGFIPLMDAAPIIIAQEMGFFEQHRLRVQLSRELGWASIRDKILYHELDAAHALGAMPLAATVGIGSPAIPCQALMVLNSHGNAITVAQRHWENGVRDAADIAAFARQCRRRTPLTFGVVFATSSHHFLMRQWLRSIGLDPNRDVRIAILPPPQVFRNLAARTIDGYCVGEPWNSSAVQQRVGFSPEVSATLAPGHPEKVLMVQRLFAETRSEECLSLVGAVMEACKFCQDVKNRRKVAEIISLPQYLNCSVDILIPGLEGPFDCGNGKKQEVESFCQFAGDAVNQPTPAKGEWFLAGLEEAGLIKADTALSIRENGMLGKIYSDDMCASAAAAPDQF